MKKILFLVPFVLLLTACGSETATTDTSTSAVTANETVSIQNFAFSPKAMTVKVGDTVQWTNGDNASHTVTSDTFDSGTLTAGQTFSTTFDTAGTYDYHCSIHPSMTGTINVQ